MSDKWEYNEWFCDGAKWFQEGQALEPGLAAVAMSGGTKQDIFAFVKGYNSVKPTPPPPVEPQKEDV